MPILKSIGRLLILYNTKVTVTFLIRTEALNTKVTVTFLIRTEALKIGACGLDFQFWHNFVIIF